MSVPPSLLNGTAMLICAIGGGFLGLAFGLVVGGPWASLAAGLLGAYAGVRTCDAALQAAWDSGAQADRVEALARAEKTRALAASDPG
ncbi:MAG: hypothetical protein K2Q06_12195 [Parvularculaceae bacterium]|nr:hypothetical protein [Parvularculaceae bacterium]